MQTAVSNANPNLPLVNGAAVRNTPDDARRRAAARRLKPKSQAIEAGKLSNVPDNQTSFEGI